MTDDERKAVFFKLEHEGPVSLTGTGLKPVAEPSERFTLAVPTAADLSGFTTKIDRFERTAPRNGIVPDSRLVTAIETVAVGQPTDRLSQELLDEYADLITRDQIICEIELLSLQQGNRQRREELQQFRHMLRGELDRDRGIGTLFEHEEIKGTCRAVIRCTGGLFQRLVEDPEWQRRIYWFEARPEFETFHRIVEDFNVAGLGPITSPSPQAETVCVIDSGVTAGNPFLRPVVRENLLRSFLRNAPDNPSDEYGHGSGVASLAAFHSLNPTAGAQNSGRVWIAGARILTAENKLEDDRLFSALLREVIEYFAPLGVKIFNLSVNIRNLSWNKNAKRTHPRRSWVARTIDELARKHDVVIIVSTGNIPPIDIREFQNDGQPYPTYFANEEACILDPGQAALAVTIGSIAPTTLAEGQVARATAIAMREQASPFTRCGPGIRKETKPDLIDYGGNYLRDDEGGQIRPNRALGVAVATHQLTPALRYDSGTSFAAPRAAHKLALILGDLKTLGIAPSASLLKAFLVNSARCRISGEELDEFQTAVGADQWRNVLGYGMADDVRATECDAHSVVLFYQGAIKPDTITFFDVPVPTNLREAGREIKRLTVTVSYGPEVQRWGLERYLGTALKWRMFRGNIPRDEVVLAMSASDEDDNGGGDGAAAVAVDEAGVPKELGFELGINRRSRGSIQHDVAQWNLHKPEFSANNYTLAIAAYEKWGRANPPDVAFAVVVRLEETSQNAEIYDEVRNALIALQVRANV